MDRVQWIGGNVLGMRKWQGKQALTAEDSINKEGRGGAKGRPGINAYQSNVN